MIDRLLIICWHNVEAAYSAPVPAGTGSAGFGEQLRWLARVADVVALDDGLRRLGERSLGPRAVALTFDDGYRDNLEVAVPLLGELGLPATVFLVPEFLSGDRDPWWEQLAWALGEAERDRIEWRGQPYDVSGHDDRWGTYAALSTKLKSFDQAARVDALAEIVAALEPQGSFCGHDVMLDWDGARGLVERGIGIGGHSSAHAILARESAEAQHADLARCRRQLEERLAVDVATLAYPNGGPGDFNPDTVAAARAAGFRYAATGIDGWNTPTTRPYELRRLFVNPAAGARGLARALKRWWDPRGRTN